MAARNQISGSGVLRWSLLLLCAACTPPSATPESPLSTLQSLLTESTDSPETTANTAAPAVAPAIIPPLHLPAWTPPQVSVADEDINATLQAAETAWREDRLYQQADDAVALWLGILSLQPEHQTARRGLKQVQQRLQRSIIALVSQPEEQYRALALADEQLAVWLYLNDYAADADEEVEAELRRRLQLAHYLFALNRSAEAALANGSLDEPRGAADMFRSVLVLDANNSRAKQGLAAVESALIRQAERAAERSSFDFAHYWLEKAAAIRKDAPTVLDARHRIETLRTTQLAGLRDAGLRELAQRPPQIKAAQALLAQAQHIAEADDPVIQTLNQRIEQAIHYGNFQPGQVFTDALSEGGRGPQMVVLPHGQFLMGSADDEHNVSETEQPQHSVHFERGFAMSITEVTVAEFGRFVHATGTRPRATRRGHSIVYNERSGNFVRRDGADWQSDHTGAPAPANNPVMHVSVRDAEAYANWLSEQTGRHYRLPSEAEFEYALRAGRNGRYPWGNAAIPPENSENVTGSEDVSPSGRHWSNAFNGYGDGWWGAAPVASFQANPWGLHDMAGNLSEWVADCWHASYRRAPIDGSAWYNPGCRRRLVRGGNWANAPQQTRAAWRLAQDSDVTSARIGFRVVRGI